MNLEQYLLINREWSYNNTYWSTRNEVRKTTTDEHGMKFEQQQLLINIDQQGMELINSES